MFPNHFFFVLFFAIESYHAKLLFGPMQSEGLDQPACFHSLIRVFTAS